MKLHFYADTDSLYIDLRAEISVESREVSPGVVLDFDAAGHLCGIDVDQASQNVDMSRLETVSLPISMETALLSEAALAKDWLRPEEDEAWQHL